MKKFVTLLFSFFVTYGFSQDAPAREKFVRKPALGLSFFFNDFITPERIRSSSLSSVLSNGQKAKLREMDPGIAFSYYKGLSNHADLAVSMNGSFVKYNLADRLIDTEKFLVEMDASVNIKLMTEKYWLSPFASIGAGVSKYGSYYGAFIPVGIGLKLNIFDEAHVFYNAQYRVPVTTGTANYHFMQGIGIAGVISSN